MIPASDTLRPDGQWQLLQYVIWRECEPLGSYPHLSPRILHRCWYLSCAVTRFSALVMRGGFDAAEHLVKIGTAKVLAVHDDSGNLLRIGNVFQGVGGK